MRSGPQVLVFPAYLNNAFLNLIELSARADGFEVTGAHTFDDLVAGAARLGRGDTLHVHWTTPIAQQAQSEAEAARRVARLERLFAGLRSRGAKLVWTVHNRLPHELTFPELEVRLYRLLASSADAIHIMAPHTPAAISDVATVDPRKIRQIAHPSYEGVYDTGITRTQARASFEISEHERAVLFLGQIRPYKGVDDLARATARANARRGGDLVLMLAGAVKEMPRAEFAASLPTEQRTISHLGFVDDADIARWFRAADVACFPYRAILNSGSVHLAATFRVPVILPGDAHLREQFAGEPWVRFFDPADPESSIADLLADDPFAGLTDGDFDAFLAPIAPWDISRQYSAMLASLAGAA
ncbi:MAG TPA: glycosyltransferase [Candidatus Microbacterium stercoravium]|uniref:Glycosyltransferase n=1 Tax=Candidatus Microbacterium stercoravium TaxID=2838697 RepID=A0A9D2H7Z2_9MICO|nr:glycosyltransferase [Candidatus Microbacterium stercoravium]